MNKKGLTIYSLTIWVGLIIILWFTFLGNILNTAGSNAVTNGGLTGIEAFFYSNLNLFLIAVPLFLFVLAGVYSTGAPK